MVVPGYQTAVRRENTALPSTATHVPRMTLISPRETANGKLPHLKMDLAGRTLRAMWLSNADERLTPRELCGSAKQPILL